MFAKHRNSKRTSLQKTENKYDEESHLKNLIKVLRIYSNIDTLTAKEKYTPTSPQKKAANFMKKAFDDMTTIIKNPMASKSIENFQISNEISKINNDMLYFLLNVTSEEFHQIFLDFYSLFDQEKDYLLSRDDFQFIISYMGSAENMGKQKLNLSLKLLSSNENVLKGALDKFSRFFITEGDSVVAPDVLNDVFEEFKDTENWNYNGREREYFIDFLKFLPILLSYFLEYMKRRIEIRRENLMVKQFQ